VEEAAEAEVEGVDADIPAVVVAVEDTWAAEEEEGAEAGTAVTKSAKRM